jgi:cytidine deaminase
LKLDQALVDATIQFIKERFPVVNDWDGAAAMYTHTGRILVSTYVESLNVGVGLCNETGAICDAHKLNEKVTASVCVGRSPETGKFEIVTPCGVCQERLFFWGPDVEVAVPDPTDSTKWIAKKLIEVQPYYWGKKYLKDLRNV